MFFLLNKRLRISLYIVSTLIFTELVTEVELWCEHGEVVVCEEFCTFIKWFLVLHIMLLGRYALTLRVCTWWRICDVCYMSVGIRTLALALVRWHLKKWGSSRRGRRHCMLAVSVFHAGMLFFFSFIVWVINSSFVGWSESFFLL